MRELWKPRADIPSFISTFVLLFHFKFQLPSPNGKFKNLIGMSALSLTFLWRTLPLACIGWKPRMDIPIPFVHLCVIWKFPINDPVDKFQFLILLLTCAPFVTFIRLFLLLNKIQSASITSHFLESSISISQVFPVRLGF